MAKIKSNTQRTKGFLPGVLTPNEYFYDRALLENNLQMQEFYTQCVFQGGIISNSASFFDPYMKKSHADFITRDIFETHKLHFHGSDISVLSSRDDLPDAETSCSVERSSNPVFSSALNSDEYVIFTRFIIDFMKTLEDFEINVFAYYLRKSKVSVLFVHAEDCVELHRLKSLIVEQEKLCTAPMKALLLQTGQSRTFCENLILTFLEKFKKFQNGERKHG